MVVLTTLLGLVAGAQQAAATGLDWQVSNAQCGGTGNKTLEVASTLTATIPGHHYAMFNDHSGGTNGPPDRASDNDLVATGTTLTGTFQVTGLHGPFVGWVRDLNDLSNSSNERTVGTVCPTPVVISDPVSPPHRPMPALSWTILGTSCRSGLVNVRTKVTGAVPGWTYALYGTSAYRASNLLTAGSASFTTTFVLTSSWKSFEGDLEAETDSGPQMSQIRSIGPACAESTSTPTPSHRSTVSTHSSTAQTITATDDGASQVSVVASPTTAPVSTSPAAQIRPASKTHTGWIVGLALVIAAGIGGVFFAVRRMLLGQS